MCCNVYNCINSHCHTLCLSENTMQLPALPQSERGPAAPLIAFHQGWWLFQQIGILHLSKRWRGLLLLRSLEHILDYVIFTQCKALEWNWHVFLSSIIIWFIASVEMYYKLTKNRSMIDGVSGCVVGTSEEGNKQTSSKNCCVRRRMCLSSVSSRKFFFRASWLVLISFNSFSSFSKVACYHFI